MRIKSLVSVMAVLSPAGVAGQAGASVPEPIGSLDGAPVLSYVWPTTLDSSMIGFESEQGILSLAATAHPDFDDTPMYDENRDGDAANDGGLWHSHWIVLAENSECGSGLAVRRRGGPSHASHLAWPPDSDRQPQLRGPVG